jgi:acetoin utilization deacetylase AcuC-like enzyme
MHCSGNYFSEVEKSDSDLEVPVGTADVEYLAMLDAWLPGVMDAAQPDLIFYQAGVDVYRKDRLGKLKLTPAGLIARDDAVCVLFSRSFTRRFYLALEV